MEALPAFDRPIAHRGLHDRAKGIIENSASAFSAACSHNFAIECDLQLSGDGKAVVFHDESLERLTGHIGSVRALSAGQITRIPLSGSHGGECPQRFETLLEQISGQVLLVVEVKQQADASGTQELAKAVVAAAKTYPGRLVLESFDPNLLVALRRHGFGGHLGIIVERAKADPTRGVSGWKAFSLQNLLHWPATRFSFISSSKSGLSLPAVRFWRARGMPATCWTVRNEHEAVAALEHSDQIVFEGYVPS